MEKEPTVQNAPLNEDFEEVDVGISEFIHPHNPIKGILKYRFQDFIVNEVNQKGEMVYLTKTAIAEEQVKKVKEHPSDKKIKEIDDEGFKDLEGIFYEEDFKNLRSYIDEINCGDKTNKNFSGKCKCPELKEDRRAVHEIIKKYLPDFESFTRELPDKSKYIEATHSLTKKKRKMYQKEEKFLHFTLMKTNIDTPGAINYIAKELRRKPGNFGVAGNKDKRGVTTQRVSLVRCEKEHLLRVSKGKNWNDNIYVGDFSYQPNGIEIGDLYGNHFSVVLRFVEVEEQRISENIEKIKQNGFINYYGMQRFGSTSVKTSDIGKEIIKKNYKKAVELIVLARTTDENINKIKKEAMDTKNYKKGIDALPFKYKIERSIFEVLKKNNENYFHAIMNLQKHIRDLYPHAYQSYLWNRVASERIRLYGLSPVEGDLVVDDLEDKIKIEKLETEEEEKKDIEDNEKEIEGDDEEAEQKLKEEITDLRANIKTKVLDASNKDKYRLDQVLIPILGYESSLPENCLYHKIFKDLLEKDGLDIDNFLKSSSKDFSVKGGLRYLVCIPENLEWRHVKFNEKYEDLISPFFKEEQEQCCKEGKFNAICMQFILKKSCYATMFIRELTKISSAFSNQMKMNKEIELIF